MEPKRFARSKNVCVFGVCAGLADYLSMSVFWMRALWVLLAIFTHWFAFIAYLVLAFVMPAPDGAPEHDRFWQHLEGRNTMIAVALVLICTGAYIIADQFLGRYVEKYMFPVGLVIAGGLLMAFAFKGNSKKQ